MEELTLNHPVNHSQGSERVRPAPTIFDELEEAGTETRGKNS